MTLYIYILSLHQIVPNQHLLNKYFWMKIFRTVQLVQMYLQWRNLHANHAANNFMINASLQIQSYGTLAMALLYKIRKLQLFRINNNQKTSKHMPIWIQLQLKTFKLQLCLNILKTTIPSLVELRITKHPVTTRQNKDLSQLHQTDNIIA